MVCDPWKEKIAAYVDSELPTEEMLPLDEHLQSCAACAAEAFAQLQIKHLTASAGRRFTPRAAFKEKIRRRVSQSPAVSSGWRWWPALAMAAILMIAVFAAVEYRIANGNREDKLSEIADIHVATLASANPVDVVSSDRHNVKPWFQGRIPFTFNLPELANTQFVLLGGRVVYLEQLPGANLIYEIRKHRISVLIFPDRPELNPFIPANRVVKAASFNTETWADSGLRYFVISDVSREDLEALCRLLKSAG